MRLPFLISIVVQICISGSILAQLGACTDQNACNYVEDADFDDGSCWYPDCAGVCGGSAVPDACGVCEGDNSTCGGCTQPGACNFTCGAYFDDGSCFFPPDGLPCSCFPAISLWGDTLGAGQALPPSTFTGSGDLSSIQIDLTSYSSLGGSWASDLLVVITSPSGDCIEFGGYSPSITASCMDLGGATEFWPSSWNTSLAGDYSATVDLGDPGMSGDGEWSVELVNGYSSPEVFYIFYEVNITIGLCAVEEAITGCTYPSACNYTPMANEDDGSCWYAAPGYDCACSAPGAIVAPDFTAVDLNGFEHNLQGLLNAGKKVIIQFMATWSGPDFAYHNSGVLQSIWTELGPSGEDQVRVFLIEGDDSTDINDLNGTGALSVGDFVTGTDFPIIDDGEAIFESFGGASYPYIVTICPNGQYTETGQTSYAGHVAALEACPDCPSPEISGCTYALALNYDPLATIDDGSCDFGPAPCAIDLDGDGVCDDVDPCVGELDALGICGGSCTSDIDGDGECDDIDCCVGQYDACGICNGPGPIYDCGCNTLPLGACDCDGNQLDAIGICGGTCLSDIDGDGICDVDDPCLGLYDECGVCNGPGAIFPCGCEASLPGACDCDGNYPDALGICGGDCASDLDGDGICDSAEIPGCMDPNACNFSIDATDDDGSCEFPEDSAFDCDGDCIWDQDGDGICDENEIVGCTDSLACNWFPPATDDVGCDYAPDGYDCLGNCILDLDGDGVCDPEESFACTDTSACNYDPLASEDNGTCIFPQPGYDCLGHGIVIGCMDPSACNYDAIATLSNDNTECIYAVLGYDCLGICMDSNGNGICDVEEVAGCTYESAENYNPLATDDDGSCSFPDTPDPGTTCPDINGDGLVSVPDLLLLLGDFGNEIDC